MKNFLHLCISCITFASVTLTAHDSTSTSINDFGSSLYIKTLSSSDKNEIFSPFSLFQGLSMAYIGAQGKTEQEMHTVLALDESREELISSLQMLNQDLSSTLQLNIANKAWIDERFDIYPSYEENLSFLGASVESIHFRNSKQSCRMINQWISEQTLGKISKLIGPQDISENTRMILVNAISFQDSWLHPFSVHKTEQDSFFSLSGDVRSVPMMQLDKVFPYYENKHIQLLLMPFKTKRFACFFILPKHSLKEAELELQKISMNDWLNQTIMTRVSVKIPRFTQRSKYPMLPILRDLGIHQAFSHSANFSLISPKNLYIENVLHEAFFSLDEKGVSAAAATGVISGITSVVIRPIESITFTANHPFLFGIVDLNSNVMLFLGKIVDL